MAPGQLPGVGLRQDANDEDVGGGPAAVEGGGTRNHARCYLLGHAQGVAHGGGIPQLRWHITPLTIAAMVSFTGTVRLAGKY